MYDIYEHEWIKSHLLITQWLIFAVLNFAGVFFLLELIFADQVPSTIPWKLKSRIIKVLQGMFVKSLFWNSSLLLSHSLIAASAMVISKFGSRLRPTEMHVYGHGQFRNYQITSLYCIALSNVWIVMFFSKNTVFLSKLNYSFQTNIF